MIKISIVDDHQMFIDGLSSILSDFDEVTLSFTAGNGRDFIKKLELQGPPDLVLLDINMPEMNGVELAEWLNQSHPKVAILVLSMHDDGKNIRRLIDLGAKGYILKNTGREELYKAIMTVYRGESYFSEVVSRNVLGSMVKAKTEVSAQEVQLSTREVEVLRAIAGGKTSQEIGEMLFISKLTVETHRKNIHRKLGVKGTAALVKYAIEQMLI